MSTDDVDARRARAQRAADGALALAKELQQRGQHAAGMAAMDDRDAYLAEVKALDAQRTETLYDQLFDEIVALVDRRIAESTDSAFPQHEWDGTRLRFETAPGVWGEWTDLRGPRGKTGAGAAGAIALQFPDVIGGGGAFDGVTSIGGGGADEAYFDGCATFGGGGAADFTPALVINGGS